MKKFWLALLLLLALIPLCAQAEELTLYMDGEPVSGTVVVDISRHPTFQMTASEEIVSWSRSSRSRITVDKSGLCTPLKTGNVTLTAKTADGDKQAVSFKFIRGVLSIKITGENELGSGQSTSLDVSVSPSNAGNKKVTWSSSDPSVATVNAYGTVKAKDVQTTTQVIITATAKDGSGVYAQFPITVRPAVQSITLYLGDQPVNGKTLALDLALGNPTLQLYAVVEPADAVQGVKWSTSSSSRAKVSGGLVTGLKKGTVTITAASTDDKDVKATCKISLSTLVKGISISGSNSLTSGESARLSASVSPSKASNKKVSWSSSDPTIASVNSYGNVTAKSVSSRQQVTITATAKDGSGVKGEYVITVYPQPQSVTLYLNGQKVNGETFALDLAGNDRIQLTASVYPADASQNITWVSSNKKVASGSDGLIVGHRKGSVTLTAYADGREVKATCKITVSTLAKSITISGANSVSSGKTIRLSASVKPSNTTNDDIAWSSSNTSAATVNQSGVVSGLDVPAITTVTIYSTARDGSGVRASHQVTVYPRPQWVNLTYNGGSLPNVLFLDSGALGSTRTVTSAVYPADASQSVKWESSNERVATVSQSGVITCKGEGRTTITVESRVDDDVNRTFYVVCGDFSAMPYYIEVDKANQVVRVYERGDGTYTKLIRRMICSSGASGTNFDNGLYSMQGGRLQWCSAGHDNIYMQYATRIRGSYMFHGVPTIGVGGNKVKNSWYQKLGSRDSGGCIRLLCADAKWIYENVPADTYVLVMAGSRNVNEYGAVYAPPSNQTGAFIWDPTDDNPANPYYDPSYTSEIK